MIQIYTVQCSFSLVYGALCLIIIIAYAGPLFVMQVAERVWIEVEGLLALVLLT
jgi:hypothetical protein